MCGRSEGTSKKNRYEICTKNKQKKERKEERKQMKGKEKKNLVTIKKKTKKTIGTVLFGLKGSVGLSSDRG